MAADFYEVISRRRDVRREFTGERIPPATLSRVLSAAHAAPSVGVTQPWDFILVHDEVTRQRFRDHVVAERAIYEQSLGNDGRQTFSRIKIEGILESSVGVVVTYDPHRGGPNALGRHTIADTGLYSTCLAIQNLWLAATAEGLGVGWVSFYREAFLATLLRIPDGIRPIAWLCVGTVSHLEQIPDLERHGWRRRRPLADAVHYEAYGATRGDDDEPALAGTAAHGATTPG